MKFCKSCKKTFKDSISNCLSCNGPLIPLDDKYLIKRNSKVGGPFTKEQITRFIKEEKLSAYDYLMNNNRQSWRRVLKFSLFRSQFSRKGNWSIKIGEQIFVNISRNQIRKQIKTGKLKPTHKAYHPSVNEWRSIEKYPEFSTLFMGDFQVCHFCGSKNPKSAVLCWKCMNSLKGYIVHDELSSELMEDKSLQQPERSPQKTPNIIETRPASKRTFFIISFILIIGIGLAFFFRKDLIGFIKKDNSLLKVEIIDTTSTWEKKTYGGYEVKNFVIKGSIRNISKKKIRVVILSGMIYNEKDELIQEKNFQVNKYRKLESEKIFPEDLIEPEEELKFEIKFYNTEIKGKEIGSWDVTVLKVIE